MKKIQLRVKGFLKNYLSKLTIVTAVLSVMAGLLPTYYMENNSPGSRLRFAMIYGILFLLIAIVFTRWLYISGHPKGLGEKPGKKAILITVLHTLLCWASIGLIEWGIQKIYQSQIWNQLSETSFFYQHRAAMINIVFYPMIAACVLFPVLLAGSGIREYWKRFSLLFLKAYPVLLFTGGGISLIQIYFNGINSLQSSNIAILGTFLLWSVTVTEYVTINQRSN